MIILILILIACVNFNLHAQVTFKKSDLKYKLSNDTISSLKPIFLEIEIDSSFNISKSENPLNILFSSVIIFGNNLIIQTLNDSKRLIFKISKNSNYIGNSFIKINGRKNETSYKIDSIAVFCKETSFQDYCHKNSCCIDSSNFINYNTITKIIYTESDDTGNEPDIQIFDSSSKNWEYIQKFIWAYIWGCNKGISSSNQNDITGGFYEKLEVYTKTNNYTFSNYGNELKCKSQINKILK